MRPIVILVLFIIFILSSFFYINSNLEKTVFVTDIIKLDENEQEVFYSVQDFDSKENIYDLKLNKDSEVIVINGSKLDAQMQEDNKIDVKIDRPNKDVILVLNSTEPITWNIDSTSSTNINFVIYSGSNSFITSKKEVFAYKTDLELVFKKESLGFIKLLRNINNLIYIDKFSYFYAKEILPKSILINNEDLDNRLSLDYLKAKKLDKNIDFQLISRDNSILDFDLYGPKKTTLKTAVISQDAVISPDYTKIYRIIPNGLKIVDLRTKKEILKPIPVTRKIVAPTGLAYDSLGDMIYLANKSGKFYVFDAEIEQWIAIRKYIEDFDISSISYDDFANTYVASSWKEEGLIFFDQKGNFSNRHSLEGKLLGLNYHYDNKKEIPKLFVVPKGEDIIILYIKEFVQKIWYYDKLNRKAHLTYNYYN